MKAAILQTISKAAGAKVLLCMEINRPCQVCSEDGDRVVCRFLNLEELLRFSRQRELPLPESFVRRRIERGDRCSGVLHEGRLAGYAWYSNLPTPLVEGLSVKFDRDYIYAYNVFTHMNYRGQRLIALPLNCALKEYLPRGYKGLLAYVENTNIRSLRALYRLGYRTFGKIFLIKAFGRFLIFHSSGCGEYGFSVIRDHSKGYPISWKAPK